MGAGALLFGPLIRHALAEAPLPRRFVLVVEGNALEPTTLVSPQTRAAIAAQASGDVSGRWFYNRYRHTAPIIVDGDLNAARILDPLGEDLTPHAAAILGLSSKIAGGGHTTYAGALSCARATPASPGGETFDVWLSRQAAVVGDAPFDVVRLGLSSGTGSLGHDTCAYGPGRPAPIILDPTLAFNTLFGAVAGAAGQRAFRDKTELLDFAAADVQRALSTFSGNATERAKLEQYLTSLETIIQRQERLAEMEDILTAVMPPDPSAGGLYTSARTLDRLQAHFDLATAALIGELTHIVVIASGTGSGFDLRYPSIIADIGRHDLHHSSAGNPDLIDAIHEVSRAHVSMIAGMARALASTPEVHADGSMLDHTAILYISDNGEQHHSTGSEWPALLLGGGALGLQTGGRSIVYPGVSDTTNNRQMSNLFNTLGHAAGQTLDDFGDEGPSRIAPGPLSALYG